MVLSTVSTSSKFPKWVALLNWVLCIAFNSKMSINDSPSLLDGQSPQENCVISHFIYASIPHDFALCIDVIPFLSIAKDLFNAIKARCCPGSHFQKLKVIRDLIHMLMENTTGNPKPNTSIILSLQCTFARFKKLGIEANKLKGLLVQASCHAPSTLDQLMTAAILSKGEEKPSSNFVGYLIMNALQRADNQTQEPSPFFCLLADPLEPR
ncbi:hypothetical protein O181_091783 [Austropuccinia psidii MF-1]|uniref:Uncharacterized protein n=1 Tax=Austropuccinia psidii MF-1 TaxID=1389203 RepID=A0A9Q3IXB8_9BASI|nr:hypothetical protein [Austropuccinia psidii MF-1]